MAAYIGLALLAGGFLYPFVRTFPDALDGGVFLNGADLINCGYLPSRDFVEPQGPGSFVWLALFFRLFGTTLETARTLLSLTGIGLALLAFHLSRRLGASGLWAFVFVLVLSVPLMPINSPHYDSNLFAMAALAVFLPPWGKLLAGRQPASWMLIAAASLCALTSWMVQQKGCYVALACLIALFAAKAKRAAFTFAAVFAAVGSLPFFYFAAVHALPELVFANYLWPLNGYSDLNAAPYAFPLGREFADLWMHPHRSPAEWFMAAGEVAAFTAVAALPFLLPVCSCWSGRRWFGLKMLPVWLAGYALWASELHRLDIGHLRNGTMLLAVLFFSISEQATRRSLRMAGMAVTMFIALMGARHFLASSAGGNEIQTRRGNAYGTGQQPLLQFLDHYTMPGDNVFIYPYQPIYYFAGKLMNPTRFSYLLYHFHTSEQFREAVRDLDSKKVRYVVFDSLLSGQNLADLFPAYRAPAKSELIVEPYLQAHYRLLKDLGRFQVLERLEPNSK